MSDCICLNKGVDVDCPRHGLVFAKRFERVVNEIPLSDEEARILLREARIDVEAAFKRMEEKIADEHSRGLTRR